MWRKTSYGLRIFNITSLRNFYYIIHSTFEVTVGLDSSVGIASCYGLDGSGIESRWGRDFPHTPKPALGPIQPSVQRVIPGGKLAGSLRWPPTPRSAEVKETVELYFYSPCVPCGLFYCDLYLWGNVNSEQLNDA